MIGSAYNDTFTGNASANTFTGNGGDDTYFVGANDTVVEGANGGTDTVYSGATFTLGANIENLTLTGSANINGTGNAGNNVITGNIGANILTGLGGNDTYIIGLGDTVVETANGGTDTIVSDATFTLGANIENLTLTGSDAINGTGNDLANVIIGNSNNNVIDGGGGANSMTGGAGDDTYYVTVGDIITENDSEGADSVFASKSYVLGAYIENLTLTGSAKINGTGNALGNVLTGNSAANVLTGLGGDDTYIIGTGDSIVEASGGGLDSVHSSASFTLGANLEDLTLTGLAAINGTGNAENNVINGNGGDNVLAGGGGDDTLDGGLGNDTASYAAATSGVIVNLSLATPQNVGGGQGTDTLISIERLLGSAYADTLTGDGAINVLTGGNGNDILDGGAGIDTLDGGYGDDTYYTDGADTLVDISKNGGIDTIVLDASYAGASYTLGAVFENLTLTGSANTNVIGNASDNILRGNAGANVLEGGAGNDTYYVGALDTIVELAGKKGGIDTVFADATFTLADPLLENLTLTGTGDFNATGNALANIIIGNAGDNTLDGGAGADTLNGGAGNDTYIVGAGDTVSEAALGGNDSVQSDASFVLGANLERSDADRACGDQRHGQCRKQRHQWQWRRQCFGRRRR